MHDDKAQVIRCAAAVRRIAAFMNLTLRKRDFVIARIAAPILAVSFSAPPKLR
jgi:hypothetical protein